MLDDYAMRRSGEAPDFSAVRGRRVLIALSGGADSVALAVMLAEARKAQALTLFAAHLDHGIRPESAEDAEFCQALCARLDIPFRCKRIDIPAEAAALRMGVETVARLRRHEWLEACRAQTECDYIALAHHMDDQAETLLMHLGRGAGPDGLRGMRTLDGNRYRPLLGWRKAELMEYLTARGLIWREDATNRLDDTPRNALRLHVIPELEKCYPQFVSAAARYAQAAQIECDYLDGLTRDYLDGNRVAHPFYIALDISGDPPRAILRRALRAACPEDLTWDRLNALEALCEQRRGRLDLGRDHFAERAGRRIYFVPKRLPTILPVPLALNGETRLEPLGRVVASPCAPVPVRDDPSRQVLDPAALQGAVLRTRRAGDRFRPLGCGDRLLSDYLTDKKIDRPLRDAMLLVAVGERVHWVCGLGISEEAKLTPGCGGVELKI